MTSWQNSEAFITHLGDIPKHQCTQTVIYCLFLVGLASRLDVPVTLCSAASARMVGIMNFKYRK